MAESGGRGQRVGAEAGTTPMGMTRLPEARAPGSTAGAEAGGRLAVLARAAENMPAAPSRIRVATTRKTTAIRMAVSAATTLTGESFCIGRETFEWTQG